jgi:WD40 repeat protein
MAGSSPQQQAEEGKNPGPSLSVTQILAPPVKSIGSGANVLHFESQSPAWHCTFSRDGLWLAACFGAPDPCIRIWKQEASTTSKTTNLNHKEWILQTTLEQVHERTIRCIAFAPIHSPIVLAAASFDGTVSIWEYASEETDWECTTQLEGHDNEVKCVAWNSTGSLLATCGRDKAVWIWESYLAGTIGGPAEGGDFECIAVLNGHEGDVKTAQFSPNHGQFGDGDEICLSASYDETIKVWAEDSGDWYCAMSIQGVHTDTIWSIALAPGGGRLLSGSADGSIAIYKCYTATEKKKMFPEESSGR